MSLVPFFSSSQLKRDQKSNKLLAQRIIDEKNVDEVQELMEILESPPNKTKLFDALKVCELIGASAPVLIKHAFRNILIHISSNTNKISWMAMNALSHITKYYPVKTYAILPIILRAVDLGGVIQRDKAVIIFLSIYKSYPNEIGGLLLDQVASCPPNQLGQYTEKWMPTISVIHCKNLITHLEQRLPDLDNVSHQKRTLKNLKKLNNTLPL